MILLSVPSKMEALPWSDFTGRVAPGFQSVGMISVVLLTPTVCCASKLCFEVNLSWNNFFLLHSKMQLIHWLLVLETWFYFCLDLSYVWPQYFFTLNNFVNVSHFLSIQQHRPSFMLIPECQTSTSIEVRNVFILLMSARKKRSAASFWQTCMSRGVRQHFQGRKRSLFKTRGLNPKPRLNTHLWHSWKPHPLGV